MSPTKIRTITLTDRAPVRINDEDWPVLADASHDTGDHDRGTSAWIRVRQHADGRAIVYATWVERRPGGWHDTRRGGRLLETATPADLVTTIRGVWADLEVPFDDGRLVQACIADLPAEVL